MLLKLLWLFPGLCCLVVAQARQGYQFDNYTTTNGLSDNRVTCFLKDREGFMWIGTENGLNRFDGHSFLIYNSALGKKFISNPFVNDIEQDTAGRLWVATQSGLNIIDSRIDSTEVFLPDDDAYQQKEKTISSDLIWDTYIDKQNRVWIAADMRDLSYYDMSKKKFLYFPWKKYIAHLFPSRINSYNSIRKIYYKSENELWLGTAAGLFSFNISTGEFTRYDSYEADHFVQLQRSRDGQNIYFVQNPGNILQALSLKNGSKRNIPFTQLSLKAGADADPGATLWLPAGKDIIAINEVTGDAALITHRIDDPYSLPDGRINNVYRENNGLIWVATSNGVGKFNPFMNKFGFTEIIPSVPRDEDSEHDLFRTDHLVHTVFLSAIDNKYYISSPSTKSLYILDKTTGVKKQFLEINGLPLSRCSVIFEDSKGLLWILAGTHAFQYDRVKMKFTVFPYSWSSDNLLFTDMAEDGEGNFWFACLNDGLYHYNIQSRQMTKFRRESGFGSTLPTSLYFDKEKNKLWIGTFEIGLYWYDFQKKSFLHFGQDKKHPNGIRSSLINDITKDKNGNIWIATYAAGIARYSYNTSQNGFSHLTTADGLPENNIYALATDSRGRVWASSYKGLSCIDPSGDSIRNYDRNYGIAFTDFYSPLMASSDGQILTGIKNGFINFDPLNTSYSSGEFPIVITSFKTKFKDIPVSGVQHTVVFPYTENEVQFSFAGLSYFFPAQTTYEYRLDGTEDDWINAGNSKLITYNNLGPGSYKFRVRARDFAGKQSSNEAVISFRILPPWWKTWWFRFSTAALVIGFVSWLLWRRINVIKRRAEVKQQMAELKEQALRAQMNPHFIFNSLNAIQELIVTENYTASYQYLSKFSKLLRMVLHLSEKNHIGLHNEIEMTRLYIELESLRFKHSFRYTIDVDSKIDTEAILFPTLLIQPFVENGIWHGLMQKQGEKLLTINFHETHEGLICSITDNGIGREKAAAIRARKIGGEHFISKATQLVQQRVEMLKAAGHQEVSIKVKDLRDEQGDAAGTCVEIIILSTEK